MQQAQKKSKIKLTRDAAAKALRKNLLRRKVRRTNRAPELSDAVNHKK